MSLTDKIERYQKGEQLSFEEYCEMLNDLIKYWNDTHD